MIDLPVRPIITFPVQTFPAIDLRKVLAGDDPLTYALDQVLMMERTAFAFIRYSEPGLLSKNAMNRLEKQFAIYRILLGR
jgi:hypothetical protein